MVSRVIVVAVVMGGLLALRLAITQNDGKLPVDRRQHEANGNECTHAQHRQYERCQPLRYVSAA
jgi:hypothetical protein